MTARGLRIRRPTVFSIVFLLTGIGLLTAGLISYALIETNSYLLAIKKFDLPQAELHAQRAQPVVQFFSTVTLHQSDDLAAWKLGLSFTENLRELQTLATQTTTSLTAAAQPLQLNLFLPPLENLEKKLLRFTELIDSSFFVTHFITPSQRQQLRLTVQALSDARPFITSLSNGKQTWVLLFQNSDELRPTGGFPGSYALVTFNGGQLEEIVVEDIYDADGQFTGFVEAPAGIREYTSSNRGLRLPDANWYPDYPKSAETMLQFFALGNKRSIGGLTSINLSVGSTLLKTTGPIWLPDYAATVTADNLYQTLREDRDEFFPGSIQKKHILSQTITAVRQKIAELPPATQLELGQSILRHLQTKDIQIYAVHPDLQAILHKYGVTGEVGLQPTTAQIGQTSCDQEKCLYDPVLFYLVEANVGINKANRFITRSVTLTQKESNKIQVVIELQNSAPANSNTLLSPVVGEVGTAKLALATNGYANYQRLLVSPEYQLKNLTINGQSETKIDTEVIRHASSGELNQYGFLVITLPANKATVEFTLEPTDPQFPLSEHPLLIQKQSGLTPVPYTLNLSGLPISFMLERDLLISEK